MREARPRHERACAVGGPTVREGPPRTPSLMVGPPTADDRRQTTGSFLPGWVSLRVAEQDERRPEVRVLERAGRFGLAGLWTLALGAAVAAGQVLRQAADLVDRQAAQP